MSVGLQATLAAYIVCSFFASIQYQWYLYYPVAYGVAMRRIYNFKKMEEITNRGNTAGSFAVREFLAKAAPAGFKKQLILYKTYTTSVVVSVSPPKTTPRVVSS